MQHKLTTESSSLLYDHDAEAAPTAQQGTSKNLGDGTVYQKADSDDFTMIEHEQARSASPVYESVSQDPKSEKPGTDTDQEQTSSTDEANTEASSQCPGNSRPAASVKKRDKGKAPVTTPSIVNSTSAFAASPAPEPTTPKASTQETDVEKQVSVPQHSGSQNRYDALMAISLLTTLTGFLFMVVLIFLRDYGSCYSHSEVFFAGTGVSWFIYGIGTFIMGLNYIDDAFYRAIVPPLLFLFTLAVPALFSGCMC